MKNSTFIETEESKGSLSILEAIEKKISSSKFSKFRSENEDFPILQSKSKKIFHDLRNFLKRFFRLLSYNKKHDNSSNTNTKKQKKEEILQPKELEDEEIELNESKLAFDSQNNSSIQEEEEEP